MPTYEVHCGRFLTIDADRVYQVDKKRYTEVDRGRSFHRESWHPPTEDEQYCDSLREWLCAQGAAYLERKAEQYRSRSRSRSRSKSRSRSGSRPRYGRKLRRPSISYFEDPAALPPYTPRLPPTTKVEKSFRRLSPSTLLSNTGTSSRDTPRIHLLSYSNDKIPTRSKANDMLDYYLGTHVKHLYTIYAVDFDVPPRHVCEKYTGTHPLVQEYVMRDPRARTAVRLAVEDLLTLLSPSKSTHGHRDEIDRGRKRVRFTEDNGKNERRRREDVAGELRKGKRRMEVAISTACQAGTHRSVTLVELIAKRLGVEAERGAFGKQGVEVKVRHVHRRKTALDPY
ncbi:hypothetical protein BDV96DRAFT_646541 [Lophiotrema nucula]|uniref:Uncharacterized protein n=1 Tax=Lophiotrema nucula TaxID=690887 RepID=A0A6A5ZAW2_9PLEO|nr:hypothetical protein BDV96DRAFT_646541 [Lophiotrema nucula]